LSARRATKQYFVWELTGLALHSLAQRPTVPREGFRGAGTGRLLWARWTR